LAIEQVPKGQEVAHGATINLAAQNTELGWSDPTFAHGSMPKVSRGSLQPNKKLLSARAARIWAKQVKKVGITYFSFVFTIFFSL
jgi:hypothetical protein